MKKTKMALGIMTAMLTAGTLAGCDNVVKYSAEGKIITYSEKDNDPVTITADILLEDYYKDSSKFQSIFDQINSIVVRNYFTIDDEVQYLGNPVKLGKEQVPQIELDAKKKVESDKKTAQTNADNNGTSYSDEFNTILSSKGAKDENELREKYIEELKKETFENNFYKYRVDTIKNGDPSIKYTSEGVEKSLWNGYFNDMVPYHVSHILVKVEDGSGTNYANGTISEDNAKKLFNVVEALAKGEDSFKTIAHRFSEDTGSAASYGDLGIMDYSTGYVNEFKLGIYAYENFLGNNRADVLASNIKIPGNTEGAPEAKSIAENFLNVTKEAYGAEIPEIDYDVFRQLKDAAEIDKDVNGKSVIDDSANFYPRNIIYNRHLNRHSVAFVTLKDTDPEASSLIIASPETEEKRTTGFVKQASGLNVLSVKTASGWTPVLCTRAGSDYQGIHFIIVNRSKFDTSAPVSLSDYYTTFYPEQEGYPHDAAGNALDTYVNFSSSVTADTKSRADSFASTIKSYDSERLNKYIFQLFFEMEKIDVKSDDLKAILVDWVTRGLDKKEQEKEESWKKLWNDYIETLRKQNDERGKLVSDACRIGYLNGNGLDGDKHKVDFDTVVDDETGTTLMQSMVKAMKDAHEEIVIDFTTQEKADAATATDAQVEAYIKSIRVGNKAIANAVSEVTDLFKKEGALCNDGKEHI